MDDIERTVTAQKEEKVMLHEYEGIIISNEFIDIALVAFHKMKLV
jgi:SAM-dependent MidA family methyltransferase